MEKINYLSEYEEERLMDISLMSDDGLINKIVDEYFSMIDRGMDSEEVLDKIEKRYINLIIGDIR